MARRAGPGPGPGPGPGTETEVSGEGGALDPAERLKRRGGDLVTRGLGALVDSIAKGIDAASETAALAEKAVGLEEKIGELQEDGVGKALARPAAEPAAEAPAVAGGWASLEAASDSAVEGPGAPPEAPPPPGKEEDARAEERAQAVARAVGGVLGAGAKDGDLDVDAFRPWARAKQEEEAADAGKGPGAAAEPGPARAGASGVEGMSVKNLAALDAALAELGLDRGREVGRGRTAAVFLAAPAGPAPFAAGEGAGAVVVKALLDGARAQKVARADFRREMLLWKDLDHPNIAKVLHTDPERLFLVGEYCDGGSLYEALQADDGYPALDVRALCRDMASALKHVHGRGIVHRDLKSLNFLLATDKTGVLACKLCDFGSAQTARRATPWCVTPEEKAEQDKEEEAKSATFLGRVMSSVAGGKSGPAAEGTPYWMAPEVLAPEEAVLEEKEIEARAFKLDIYSFGVTLWEVLNRGKIPWYSDFGLQERDEVVQAVKVDRRTLPLREGLNTELVEMLGLCWDPDPRERPTADFVAFTLGRLAGKEWDEDGALAAEAKRANSRILYDGEYYPVSRGAAFWIGRLGTSDLVLSDTAVSRQHAKIAFDAEEGAYVLTDPGSTNGTSVDGLDAKRKPRPLRDGAKIALADYKHRMKFLSS